MTALSNRTSSGPAGVVDEDDDDDDVDAIAGAAAGAAVGSGEAPPAWDFAPPKAQGTRETQVGQVDHARRVDPPISPRIGIIVAAVPRR